MLALAVLTLPTVLAGQDESRTEPAKLVGTVTDTARKPLEGIRVTVTLEVESGPELRATTDANGRFNLSISGPGGEYSFTLEGPGYAPFQGKVPLVAGEEAEIAFVLLDVETANRQEATKAYNAGVKEFGLERWAAAEAKFLEARRLDPKFAEAHIGLAEVLFREGSLEEAASAAEKALAIKGADPNLLTLLYSIHRQLGNNERAEQLIDALAKTDRARGLATEIYNQGALAMQAGDSARALERFRRASSVDPELSVAYAAQATILYNEERFDEARVALEKLFARDASNVQGRRIHYLIFDAEGDDANAAGAFEAYLAVDAEGAIEVLYQRADMDFRDGNSAKAVAALERLLELRPDFARAHYTLGLCYSAIDKTKARYHLERFIDLAPDDPEVATAREMMSYL